jgi:F-type H+-transporting ATPase subunit epsilon
MTDKTFYLEIITPDRILLSSDVESIELPGAEGEFQVLNGHTPFLTPLKIGHIIIERGIEKSIVCIAGGYCEVMPNKVVVLIHAGEFPHEIDKGRAEASRKRALDRLSDATDSTPINTNRAHVSLLRALNRLKVADMRMSE